jgi:flagellar basal-body rod protein FlgG
MVATAKIFTQGQLKQTGEKFDIAIQGDGFLQIQKVDGTFAYTRDGNLKIDQQGRFTTSDGLVIQSGFQPIPPGTTEVSIAPTGEVTARGPNGVVQFQAQLARFPNPSGLRAVGGNLYEDTIASGPFELGRPGLQGFGTMIQGYLETSNVNIVEEMVNMIQAQRAYELNSKSITTSDEMLGQVAQLKR